MPVVQEPTPGLKEAPIACLRTGTTACFAVYIEPAPNSTPVLYSGRDVTISPETYDRLLANRISHVFIREEEWDDFLQYIEENLAHLLSSADVSKGQKAALLYDSAQNLMHRIMDNPDAPELLKRGQELARRMVTFLQGERGMLEELLRVASFDYQTYTHSVNVFLFSNTLARAVNITDVKDLREFGIGTLLHDIGKSRLDPAIVQSRRKLNDGQWQLMRMHPVWGWEMAREHGGFGPMALDVILHHHEKLNGNGYPDGLSHNRISKFVRIATICDIFDALTTRRSYKDAMDSFPALTLMREQMAGELDADIFGAFVRIMAEPGKH